MKTKLNRRKQARYGTQHSKALNEFGLKTQHSKAHYKTQHSKAKYETQHRKAKYETQLIAV